ncbi:MAG: MFS transporter [Kiritimatiellae bacterium]|nr:MFS transporter [Kiritimatiellia bacterium]
MVENTKKNQVFAEFQSSASLRRWKWRILLATMACYLFYYCGRFNLAICLKPIMNEFGWDKAQMGFLVSVLIVSYGIGQFINGNLTDRFGRVLMPVGAIVSCLANWAFSYASEFSSFFASLIGITSTSAMTFGTMAVFWGINGYFQAMGMAPGGRLISNWWAHHERGTAMGLYTFAAAMANVTVFLLASATASAWGWRAAFRYPVLLMAGGVNGLIGVK